MTATLEDRLAAALRTQAGRLTGPPPGLGDAVVRRGRRVRRRRRADAAACAALLVAGIAVFSSPLRPDRAGLPDEPYATPSDVPTIAVDSGAWAEGDATSIPYSLGSLIVYDDTDPLGYDLLTGSVSAGGSTLVTTTAVYDMRTGTYLAAAAGEDGATLFLSDPTAGGPPVELVSNGIGEPVVSPDGRRVAWVVLGGYGSVEAVDDKRLILYDLATGDTTDGPKVSDKMAVAGFRGDRVVVTSAAEGPIREWDPATDGFTDVGVDGDVVDVRDDLALLTTNGCAVAVDGAWSQLWRDCGLRVSSGAISPGGDQVVARASHDELVVVDSRTGERSSVMSGVEVRPDAVSERALRWEGDGRVVFLAATADELPRVARCTLSAGRCEWAGRPPPYDRVVNEGEEPVGIVLGQALDPRRAG